MLNLSLVAARNQGGALSLRRLLAAVTLAACHLAMVRLVYPMIRTDVHQAILLTAAVLIPGVPLAIIAWACRSWWSVCGALAGSLLGGVYGLDWVNLDYVERDPREELRLFLFLAFLGAITGLLVMQWLVTLDLLAQPSWNDKPPKD